MSNNYNLLQYLNVHNIDESDYHEQVTLQRDYKYWRATHLVKPGDRIVIEARGRRVSGLVTYRDFDQWDNMWDIEMTDASTGDGYSHWKQSFDGGNITEINGLEVELLW